MVKLFPRSDPFAANAIGMAAGTLMLVALSLVSGERLTLPSRGSTWAAVATLVVLGGVVLFFLLLVVLRRWTASALSYAFVLFPIVALLLSVALEGDARDPGDPRRDRDRGGRGVRGRACPRAAEPGSRARPRAGRRVTPRLSPSAVNG